MWIPNAFLPTCVATIVNLFLVVYLIRTNVRKPGNIAAFFIFLSILIWSVGELVERIAGPPPLDENMAYLGARFLFIGISILSAAFIHLFLDYPYRIRLKPGHRMAVLYLTYGFSVAGIVLDAINDYVGNIVIQGMTPYTAFGQTIWGLVPGPVYKLYISWLFVTGLIVLVGLLLKLRNVKMKIVRMQIWFTFTGMLIAYILVTSTGYIPVLLNMNVYPFTTISFSIFGIFVIYTIYRYRLFLVVPTSEVVEMKEELPRKGLHLLPKEEAYVKFANLARSGYKSLGFISENVEKFKEMYGLKATPIFEIAEKPGKDRLNPQIEEQKEMILFIISTFLEDVDNPVILLDFTSKHIGDDLRDALIKEISEEYGNMGVFLVATGNFEKT